MQAAQRNSRRVQWRFLALVLLVLWLPFRSWAAEEDLPPLPELEKMPSLWMKDFEVRAWSGYKDNVLLGSRNVVGSPFVAGGLDMMFYRLPVNGWEYLLFTSADYIRYLSIDIEQAKREAMALVQAQAKKSFSNGWRTALSAEYLYFNQVFDNSVLGTVLTALPVQGHAFTLRPSVGKDVGQGYRLELELPGTRQIFDEFIDDYWEFGPKLTFGREFGNKSDLAIAYQFTDRRHDTRLPRDADGNLEPGERLEFYQHELSGAWKQFWDVGRHWRTLTRLSLQRNDDNGGGYYAYWRPQLSEQLRYQTKTWEIRAEAKVAYYTYDHQRVDDASSPLREKAYVRASLRGERVVVKSLKLFGQYEFEEAFSNLEFDRYTVHIFSAGLDWTF